MCEALEVLCEKVRERGKGKEGTKKSMEGKEGRKERKVR